MTELTTDSLPEADPEITRRGYRLEEVTAHEPGFLSIYRASVVETGERVEVRVFPVPEDSRVRRRFKRTIKKRLALTHPSLLPIREALGRDEDLYLVTDFNPAPTLTSRMEEGPLEGDVAFGTLSQIAEAIDAAQAAGVTDQLLGPDGILMAEGEGSRAVLADTGVAISLRQMIAPWMHPHAHYFAPELGHCEHEGGPTSVYSLGCILFECLTGSRPYDGNWIELSYAHACAPIPAVSESRPELGTEIDAVIERALDKEPAERYSSAGELMRAVKTALFADKAPVAEPPSSPRRTPRRRRPRINGTNGADEGRLPDLAKTLPAANLLPAPTPKPRRRRATRPETTTAMSPPAMAPSTVDPAPPFPRSGIEPGVERQRRSPALAYRHLLAIALLIAASTAGLLLGRAGDPDSPERAASQAEVQRARAAAVHDARLSGSISTLNTRRIEGRAQLRAARTSRGQKSAALALASAHENAERALPGTAPSRGLTAAEGRIRASLRGVARAYRGLANAAVRGTGYAAAAGAVKRREDSLRQAVDRAAALQRRE